MVKSRFGNAYRYSVLVLALLLGLALVADQAFAAPGGNNKGKGKGKGGNSDSQIQAQLVVNPSSCPRWGEFTLTGSGFQPDRTVVVAIKRICADGAVWDWSWWSGGTTDSTGNVTISGTAWQCVGTTEFNAVQFVDGTTYSATASMGIY